MRNALFTALNGNNTMSVNPMQQLIADAQKLKQTIQNPRAEVERLLQSGQMSQSQFDSLAQQASRIIGGGVFNK